MGIRRAFRTSSTILVCSQGSETVLWELLGAGSWGLPLISLTFLGGQPGTEELKTDSVHWDFLRSARINQRTNSLLHLCTNPLDACDKEHGGLKFLLSLNQDRLMWIHKKGGNALRMFLQIFLCWALAYKGKILKSHSSYYFTQD